MYGSFIGLFYIFINLMVKCCPIAQKISCPRIGDTNFNLIKKAKIIILLNNILTTLKIMLYRVFKTTNSEFGTIFTITLWLLKMCPTYWSPLSDIYKKQ